jgi:2-(1,2-epoxy-1,2-dihydrophenyl)acetyl-CoA isomerase
VFFGDDCPAEEAARIGLVNKVIPPEELEATAAEWAGRLATGPTPAISLAKSLLNRSLDADRATAFAAEAAAQEIAMTSEDAAEGVRSFVERRPPVFRGW